MPVLKISTNILNNKIPQDFVKNFLPVLAKSINKPVERIVVTVSAGCYQSMNGDQETPCVIASLESIGNQGVNEKKIIAKEITAYIEKSLGVNKDRVLITFYDLKPYNVAKSGETYG